MRFWSTLVVAISECQLGLARICLMDTGSAPAKNAVDISKNICYNGVS